MANWQPAEPFKDLNISSTSILDELSERSPCTKCHRSKMYFCYNCLLPVEALQGKIPHVQLPLAVDIIKHQHETNGKSTAVHAAVLAPEYVTLRTFPDVGSYDPAETVLVFPADGAESVANVCAEFAAARREIRRAVFVDCTWNQCRRLLSDGRLGQLLAVQLQSHHTHFWRYQRGKPRSHLATIEAVYYFVRELHQARHASYRGQFDDLLFFFDYFYKMLYRSRPVGSLWAYRAESEWSRRTGQTRQRRSTAAEPADKTAAAYRVKSRPEQTGSPPDRTRSRSEQTGSPPDRTESRSEQTGSPPDRTESRPEQTGSPPDRTQSRSEQNGSSHDRTKSCPERGGTTDWATRDSGRGQPMHSARLGGKAEGRPSV